MFWKKDKKDPFEAKIGEMPLLSPDDIPELGANFGKAQPNTVDTKREEEIRIPTPEEFGLEIQNSDSNPQKIQATNEIPIATPEKKGIFNKIFTPKKDVPKQDIGAPLPLSDINPFELSQVPQNADALNIPLPDSLSGADMGIIDSRGTNTGYNKMLIETSNQIVSQEKENKVAPSPISKDAPKQPVEKVLTGIKKDEQLIQKIQKLEKTILDYRKEIEETSEKIALITKDLKIKDLNIAVKRKAKPKKSGKIKKSKPKKAIKKKQKTTAKKRKRK